MSIHRASAPNPRKRARLDGRHANWVDPISLRAWIAVAATYSLIAVAGFGFGIGVAMLSLWAVQ
jgi:hypothetical protein